MKTDDFDHYLNHLAAALEHVDRLAKHNVSERMG
jgi:hypothetical protein